MKNLKEFRNLASLIKGDKFKLIIASLLILIAGLSEICAGYLNGAAVEAITGLYLKKAIMYLLIYLLIYLTLNGIVLYVGNSMILKIESSLTRKLCFFTYKKALNLPAVAFEQKSSGEIINRITNDADSLSFTFGRLLNVLSSLIGSFLIIFYTQLSILFLAFLQSAPLIAIASSNTFAPLQTFLTSFGTFASPDPS